MSVSVGLGRKHECYSDEQGAAECRATAFRQLPMPQSRCKDSSVSQRVKRLTKVTRVLSLQHSNWRAISVNRRNGTCKTAPVSA